MESRSLMKIWHIGLRALSCMQHCFAVGRRLSVHFETNRECLRGVETMKWQIGLVCALSVFGLAMAQSQVSPGVSSSENFQLGLKYEREGEFPLAFLAYKRSGDSGNADGYLKIAKMYEEGQLGSGGDSEATGEQAVPWYQKAASSGNPEAQKWLASHSKLVQELALSTAAAESTAQSTAQAIAQ